MISQIDGSRRVEIKTSSGTLTLSKKERQRLEYFFRDLIVYDCGGYTLLGNKPITFDCMLEPVFKWDFFFLWDAFLPSNLKKHSGWKTFQKYRHLICEENILVWIEPSPWNENVQFIMLANKKELYRVIAENKQDFQSVTWEDLQIKPLFKELLQSHEGLIGTVLGYGRNNAWLFRENRALLPNTGIFSQEIDHLFENRKASLNFTLGWPEVPMDEILMYPMFRAKLDSEETEKLKVGYLETRKAILAHYKGKDFLEATFQLLAKE